MAWRSLGHDAVNRNTHPLDWLERENPHKLLTCRVTPDFHQEVKQYCQESHIEVPSNSVTVIQGAETEQVIQRNPLITESHTARCK